MNNNIIDSIYVQVEALAKGGFFIILFCIVMLLLKKSIDCLYYQCSKSNKVDLNKSISFKSVKEVRKYFKDMKANWTVLDWIEHWWHIYFWNHIRYIPSNIKYFIQRGKRGYSDQDVWNFSDYLSDVISQGVRQLIKEQHGYPNNLTDKQWKSILRKIAKTFELYEIGRRRQLTNKECEIFERGWELFKEYFESLWD